MAEIIAIANQKGGVGKTTTAINLAAAIAALGQETLLVDMDPQGNATSGIGFNKKTVDPTIYDVLTGLAPIEQAIRPTEIEFLDAICANNDLIGAEVELVSAEARETRLREALEPIRSAYRIIVVDCPPSLGLLTINCLSAADGVIVPMQCEYYALEGLAYFMDAMGKVKAAINRGLRVEGIVMTMFDPRISLANQVRSEIESHFKDALFKTPIPRNIRLAEAPSFGKPILQYDPRSKGAEAYVLLARELLIRKGARDLGSIAPTQAVPA